MQAAESPERQALEPAPGPDGKPGLRLPELDGLRGMAILLVVIWHFWACLVQPAPGSATAVAVWPFRFAWSGVDLFFVLSGFLIGGILMDQRESANYYRVFYFRRICRIFPLYYAWLLLFVLLRFALPLLSGSLGALFRQHDIPLWSYGLFLQNFTMARAGEFGPVWLSATWSLAIEEQFYLLLPLLIRWVPPRRLPWALLPLIGAAPLIRIALYQLYPGNFLPIYMLMPCRADALLLGVLCAWGMRREDFRGWLAGHRLMLYLLLAALAAGTALMISRGYRFESFGLSSWGYSWLALLYACLLLLGVSEQRGPVTALLRWRPLRWVGLLAYGIYIFHQEIFSLSHKLILHRYPQMSAPADYLVAGFAFALTLLVAWISWNWFERPLVRIGHARPYLPKPRN